MERAYLQVHHDGGADLVELDGDLVTIGREVTDAASFPADAMVSRDHAVVERTENGWCLRDTGSSNGTFVNGRRIADAHLLQLGDVITVGISRMTFVVNGSGEDGAEGPPSQSPVDMSATSAGFDFVIDDAEPRPARAPADSYPAPEVQEGAPPPPAEPQSDRRHGQVTVVGQVRGIQQRTEGYSGQAGTVLTFRVERYDASGNRLQPVPVQLRALGYDGVLSEGDGVRITGRWEDGTLHTSRVHNLTTGASVHGKSIKKRVLISLAIFLAIAAVMAIVFIVISIRAEGSFHNDVDKQHRTFCEQVKQNGQTPPGC